MDEIKRTTVTKWLLSSNHERSIQFGMWLFESNYPLEFWDSPEYSKNVHAFEPGSTDEYKFKLESFCHLYEQFLKEINNQTKTK